MEIKRIVYSQNRIGNHYHPCCEQEMLPKPQIENATKRQYSCPRGHTFETETPIVVAVDNDPEYNSGPVCSYCYVNWFKAHVNADEVVVEL